MAANYQTKAFEFAEQFGWSLYELSRRSGVHIATLYRIKKGERGCGPKTMLGLMRAFPWASFETLFFVPDDSHKTDEAGRKTAPVGNTTEAA